MSDDPAEEGKAVRPPRPTIPQGLHTERLDSEPVLLTRAALSAALNLMRSNSGRIGGIILALVIVCSAFAPAITTCGPLQLSDASQLSPSAKHLLGTDNVGRDLLAGVVYAGRTSLTVGFSAATLAFVIGTFVGAMAAYFRGTVEGVLMRIADLFQTIPTIIVVLFLVAMLGSSTWLRTVAVALAIWPLEARMVYGQFISLQEREFVLAAQTAGLSARHILLREILPNALPPVIVQVALDASFAILIEAGLGFLGLSDPSVPSWGEQLSRGQAFLDSAWWMSVFPGTAICITVLGINLVADGFNEMFNPRAFDGAPKLPN